MKHFFTFVWCFSVCLLLVGVLLIMSGRLLVGCGVPIHYYIYKSGAAIGCRLVAVALQVSGCRLLLRVSGYGVRIISGGCQLSAIGCASCRGCCCLCRAVGCFPGCSSLCRLVVSWSGCCCPHVGRFSVVLSHLVGVSVASDGVRCCPHIGSRAGCSCSPDVGRVSRSSCRDRLPLLFVVSWSGCCSCPPIGCRCSSLSVGRGCRGALWLLFGALRGAFVLTY